VQFRDEDFYADGGRADAIARALGEAPVRLGWRVTLRPRDVLEGGRERLDLLRGAGCRKVSVDLVDGVTTSGSLREAVLETGVRLHEAGLAARFPLALAEPGRKLEELRRVITLARKLTALDPRFETPLGRAMPLPQLGHAGEGEDGLEVWATRTEAPWGDARASRHLRRASFYITEGQRRPGRRLGQRLLRRLALLRVRAGFFGLDFERGAVEASSVLRTGRPRTATPPD
jgi:hypothetical protein